MYMIFVKFVVAKMFFFYLMLTEVAFICLKYNKNSNIVEYYNNYK